MPVNQRGNGWTCLYSQLQSVDTAKVTTNNNGSENFDLDNRGLAYGDGFFTTMGVSDGVILWLDYHQQRIQSHSAALQLAIDSTALRVTLQAHAQQLQHGMLKLIVTRAPQAMRGYGFTPTESGSACEMWLKATMMPLPTHQPINTVHAYLPNGCTVLMQPVISAACLQAQIACLPPPLAGLKTLNRLDNVLASSELQRFKVTRPNIGEGLVRDMMGNWVEGTMSNIFYQLALPPSIEPQLPISPSTTTSLRLSNAINSDDAPSDYLLTGRWFTPPLTQSGVTGILRQVIMDAFATTENPVVMRALTTDDLPQLSRLFFCNAVRGVIPVDELMIDSTQGSVSFDNKGLIT